MIREISIKNLHLQNYKSIVDLKVEFNKGLNIIIGENGAGKSNLLDFLKKFLEEDTRPSKTSRKNNLKHSAIYQLGIEYKNGDDNYTIQLKNKGSIRKNDFDEELIGLVYSLFRNDKILFENESIFKIVDNLNGKRKASMSRLLSLYIRFSFIGFNEPSLLSYITAPNKLTFDKENGIVSEVIEYIPFLTPFEGELEDELSRINLDNLPTQVKEIVVKTFKTVIKDFNLLFFLKKITLITDIKLNDSINVFSLNNKTIIDNIQVVFKINGNWLPWSFLSDGTKRIFYIILHALDSTNHLMLIEEPELGIHPQQLYKLMTFLKEISIEKQIFITTHSPIALDVLNLDELGSIIIAKYTKKGTQMAHLTNDQKLKADAYVQEVGNLSSYWLHSDLEK